MKIVTNINTTAHKNDRSIEEQTAAADEAAVTAFCILEDRQSHTKGNRGRDPGSHFRAYIRLVQST